MIGQAGSLLPTTNLQRTLGLATRLLRAGGGAAAGVMVAR